MCYTEAELRDKLINKLHILDKSLVFLEKETYIPNSLGTRGFIDILARDDKGHLVVIELKKSNSSSREALHEVLKYLEGIKKQKGLRDDEICTMIVSTHWQELIVPFSSFYGQCKCNIEGYQLKLNDSFEPIYAEKIDPLLLNNGRLFCDHHMLRVYTSEENMKVGVESHIKCFEEKGVSDYVLVVLNAPDGWRNKELTAIESNLKQFYKKVEDNPSNETDTMQRIREHLPDYKFIIYSATLLQDEKSYWSIIEKDKDIFEEVSEIIDDYEGEDKIDTLHDYAVDCVKPIPICDTSQIGNAAKFEKYTENDGWTISQIIRSGALSNNEILSDEIILNELKGSAGTTRQKYMKNFSSGNNADFTQMEKEIQVCLSDNLQWQRPILHIIEQLRELSKKKDFRGRVYIYNPMHTIYSIYLIACSGNPVQWTPNFYITLDMEDEIFLYFGCLERNGKKPILEATLKEFYDDSLFDLFYSLTWGGYQHNDTKIANSLGLNYSTYLMKNINGTSVFYEYTDYEFQECDSHDPFRPFIDYLREEKAMVEDIINLFENRADEMGYTII